MKNLTLTALLLIVASATAAPSLGLQTWTCRKMTFDEMVAFATVHHINRIQLISAHVNPGDPLEVNLRKLAVLRESGVTAYSLYADTGISLDADRKIFETAQLFGLKFIVVEPKSMESWPGLVAMAREYGIKLAVHNHGRGTPYAEPSVVRKLLDDYKELGVCLDVAWVSVMGYDVAEVFRSYRDRVLDIHFRDKRISSTKNGIEYSDAEPGKGEVDFPGLFRAIRETGWSGTLAIETDHKDYRDNPGPLVTQFREIFSREFLIPALESSNSSN